MPKESWKSTPIISERERPIVERPERWREKGCDCVGCLREDEIFRYIEHLEHNLKVTEKALSDAHDRLEALYEKYGPDIENVRR